MLNILKPLPGNVTSISSTKYQTAGKFTRSRSQRTAVITELPIGVWTETYLDRLKAMKNDKKIVSFDDFSSDVDVKLSVKLSTELNRLKVGL